MLDMVSPRRLTVAVILGVIAIAVLMASGKLVESIEADEYVVIQSPVEGRLDWYTKPGLVWQGFGDPTEYKIRSIYNFGERGYEVRFKDGGHGNIIGSIQYELPSDTEKLNAIHRRYKGQERVSKELVQTATNAALYLVGTLMTSRESYDEKRNDLIHYVTDQVQNGIYRTRQKREWIKDPVTNETKEVIAAEIIMDKDGSPERQEISPLKVYGVKVSNFAINRLPYDPVVEKQIQQQQQITMDVQTSIAELKKAEQRALTVEQQGRANATETKWQQEAIKAREVTKAEQEKAVATTNADRDRIVALTNADRDRKVAETQAAQRLAVADFDRQAAEQTKLQQILLGEGESQRKRLVLEADNALEQKLAAYVTVTPKIFEALRGTAFVPSVMMSGNGGTTAHTTALPLIDLLTAKTAKDLALDLGIAPGPRVQPAAVR